MASKKIQWQFDKLLNSNEKVLCFYKAVEEIREFSTFAQEATNNLFKLKIYWNCCCLALHCIALLWIAYKWLFFFLSVHCSSEHHLTKLSHCHFLWTWQSWHGYRTSRRSTRFFLSPSVASTSLFRFVKIAFNILRIAFESEEKLLKSNSYYIMLRSASVLVAILFIASIEIKLKMSARRTIQFDCGYDLHFT